MTSSKVCWCCHCRDVEMRAFTLHALLFHLCVSVSYAFGATTESTREMAEISKMSFSTTEKTLPGRLESTTNKHQNSPAGMEDSGLLAIAGGKPPGQFSTDSTLLGLPTEADVTSESWKSSSTNSDSEEYSSRDNVDRLAGSATESYAEPDLMGDEGAEETERDGLQSINGSATENYPSRALAKYDNSTNMPNTGERNFTSSPGRLNPMMTVKGSISMATVLQVRNVVLVTNAVLSTVGIALNVPSLLVFQKMSPSVCNSYMASLLVLDTACLALTFPMSVVEMVYEQLGPLPLTYVQFRTYFGLVGLIGLRHAIFIVTSLMTMDRSFSLMFPQRNVGRNPLRYPKVSTAVATVLALAFTASDTGTRLEIVPRVDPGSGASSYVVQLNAFHFSHLAVYSKVVLVSNTFFRFIPVSLIVVSNLALCASLVRHHHDVRSEGIRSEAVTRRQRVVMRSVKVVNIYAFVFLLLGLPFTVFLLVDNAWPHLSQQEPLLGGLLTVLFPLLDVLGSAADFFVYFTVSRAFRAGFKQRLTA